MKKMIREQVMRLMGEEIENLVSDLIEQKVKESVEDWYINHNLKDYVRNKIDEEYEPDNDSIEVEIDAYIEGYING